ncbi:putative F-box/LRR-repeat protein At4g00320 [Andrographis paniculata]|uniref:putative F-box/LRR-repeat protein At4g00320 n=1 Tax=Andrographis paniculata TaxID=175694 RepID=UPI0021E6FB29|nr:putative F-box/LRR-repeat protein At4g00320 [Andrographis paniculata]
MEEKRRREIDDGERGNQLPVPAIQHIQSFLGGRQAARTSVISKSWYVAWLTRPNLYFNQRCFDEYRSLRFVEFVKKTMKRYEESDLNINGFNIRLFSRYLHCTSDESIVSTELIKKILRLCVNGADCKFEFMSSCYVLPSELLATEKLQSLSVLGCKINRPVGGRVEFSILKSIRLEYISMDGDLFKDAFPCLEDLTLLCCHGYKQLEISSTNLKWLTIEDNRIIKVNFTIPNIRRFVFAGSCSPLLLLTAVSKEWECDISLKYLHHKLNESWFHKLTDLSRKLSASMCKVSLSIVFFGHNGVDRRASCSGWTKPKLDNLTLSVPSPFFGYDFLLETLFVSCHPRFVTQYWFPDPCGEEKANNKWVKFLFKRLLQDKGSVSYGYSERSLIRETEVEIFDDGLDEWQPLAWRTLLEHGEGRKGKRKIRFRLEWEY